MKVIGLTGQSGAGKGTVASILAKHDIPHIDCDKVYHSLLVSDTDCTKALAKTFGPEILAENGSVDRKKLGAIVFTGEGHEKRLDTLNKITHKYVLDECRKKLRVYADEGKKAAVVDAPTLFESGFDKECDILLAVITPEEIRLNRILKRDGISRDKAKERFAAQLSEEYFRKHADHIIENSSDTDALASEVQKFIREKLS
ncbi:MAG: dephospho-CoA kinase [Clostridia bacterium]|nr:dephospho-CoA kinase [Clostridia bacterium]